MNHYGFSVKKYHEMIGRPTTFNFMTPNDNIPYYFTEDDINRIFAVIPNVKHNCMLMVMFYGCLRASELCGLDDKDIDFETRSIKIRAGKGGRDAIVPLKPEVAQVIRDYLEIRPSIKIGDEHPLFITDYKNRWSKETLHVMFKKYKKLAKITKPGGLHVFGRHSPASIMIKNGCDIMTIKEIMRHKDIKTTARYLHISDQTKRLKYEQFLVL
jgi:integrase/recombinase XerD